MQGVNPSERGKALGALTDAPLDVLILSADIACDAAMATMVVMALASFCTRVSTGTLGAVAQPVRQPASAVARARKQNSSVARRMDSGLIFMVVFGLAGAARTVTGDRKTHLPQF